MGYGANGDCVGAGKDVGDGVIVNVGDASGVCVMVGVLVGVGKTNPDCVKIRSET